MGKKIRFTFIIKKHLNRRAYIKKICQDATNINNMEHKFDKYIMFINPKKLTIYVEYILSNVIFSFSYLIPPFIIKFYLWSLNHLKNKDLYIYEYKHIINDLSHNIFSILLVYQINTVYLQMKRIMYWLD